MASSTDNVLDPHVSVAQSIYHFLGLHESYNDDLVVWTKHLAETKESCSKTTVETSGRNAFEKTVVEYFGQLTTYSKPALMREPKSLEAEEIRVGKDIEDVALKHYKVFVRGSHLLSHLINQVDQLGSCLADLRTDIAKFFLSAQSVHDQAEALIQKRKQLAAFAQHRGVVTKILSSRPLLEACLANEMFDDTFKILDFFYTLAERMTRLAEDSDATTAKANLVQAASFLRIFNATELDHVRRLLLNRLSSQSLEFPACFATYSCLKRLERLRQTNEIGEPFLYCLEQSVLAHLAFPIEALKRQAECTFRDHPADAMVYAADILQTHVASVASTFSQLAPDSSIAETQLYSWITLQIQWFVSGLLQLLDVSTQTASESKKLVFRENNVGQPGRCGLLPSHGGSMIFTGANSLAAPSSLDSDQSSLSLAYIPPTEEEMRWLEDQGVNALSSTPLDAVRLLYCRTWDASQAFKHFRYSFFPLVSTIFDTYLQRYIRVHLHQAVQKLQADCVHHDWSLSSDVDRNVVTLSYVLERQPPLTQFVDAIIRCLNELRDCALQSISAFTARSLAVVLIAAVRTLRESAYRIGILDASGRRVGYWAVDPGPPLALVNTFETAAVHRDVSRTHKAQVEGFLLACLAFEKHALPLLFQYLTALFPEVPHHYEKDIVLEQLSGLLPVCVEKPSSTTKNEKDLYDGTESLDRTASPLAEHPLASEHSDDGDEVLASVI